MDSERRDVANVLVSIGDGELGGVEIRIVIKFFSTVEEGM